ncbi:hypothetical protein BH23BAC4_BH23BAC4_15670 [soil metagenome]
MMVGVVRSVFAVVWLLASISIAQAQVELIVRVADDGGEVVLEQLSLMSEMAESPEMAADLPQDATIFFERVMEVRRPLERAHASVPDGRRRTDHWTGRVFTLTFPDSTSMRSALAEWENRPGVAYAQANGAYRLDMLPAGAVEFVQNDPYADSLGHLDVTRTRTAWAVTQGNPDVLIGLLDTGLFFEHPDLQGQVWVNPGEIANTGRDDDGNGYIDDVHGYDFVDRRDMVEPGDYRDRDPDPSEDGTQDHGTIVAGIMSAAFNNGIGGSGAAPGARLVVLRAFGRDGIAVDADVAAALVYAADNGLDVVNMSFGRDYHSHLLHEAIRYAHDRGVVLVASGGNAGGDAPHYPSDYPEVIGVAWLSADGTRIASRGQYGPGIDLGAPGSAIFSTLMPRPNDERPLEERLYGRRDGSSLAAPQVSAAVALLRSVEPSMSPEAVRAALTASARDIGEPGWDHRTGAGLLDVAAALGLAFKAEVALAQPLQDDGTPGSPLEIRGTVVAAQFDSWEVLIAPYDDTAQTTIGSWERLAGPVTNQVRNELLATWQPGNRPDGTYLIQLRANLRTGRTIERRHRVLLRRTPPEINVLFAGPALYDGRQGILVEIETDGVTSAEMSIPGLVAEPIMAPRSARRHGLFYPNTPARTGVFEVTITAEHAAGLRTSVSRSISLDHLPLHTGLLEITDLDIPHGYLMDRPADFDGDGLLEIVFNRYQDGWLGDTLMVYEWAGTPGEPVFREAAAVHLPTASARPESQGQLEALHPRVFYEIGAFPRDFGDTEGDGRKELLLQVGPVTLLLEASVPGGYPDRIKFIDETALNPAALAAGGDVLWGARLADLNENGRGQIIGHNQRLGSNPDGSPRRTSWRVMEWNGTTFTEIARAGNPTAPDPNGLATTNAFQEPIVVVGDLNRNGVPGFLAGDEDGDLILYEWRQGALVPVWTRETRRYNAGSRFGVGDFTGDGFDDVWTFTSPFSGPSDQAPFGLATFFQGDGEGLAIRDSIAFQGFSSRHGSFVAADLDGDGISELVVVHPPDLWVLSALMNWQPIYHTRELAGPAGPPEGVPDGFRSIQMVAADFSGNGADEVVVAGADGRMRMLSYRFADAGVAPPLWIAAHPAGPDSLYIEWTAPAADSVAVFSAPAGKALSLDTTFTDTRLTFAADEPRDVSLTAWVNGERSGLAPIRRIAPRALTTIESVAYPTARSLEVRFSHPLDRDTHARQFALASGPRPVSAILDAHYRKVVLHFDEVTQGDDHLLWSELLDADGAPVVAMDVPLSWPVAPADHQLVLESWDVLDTRTVRLQFSEPLEPSSASASGNYEVRVPPSETSSAAVANVSFDPAEPTEVVVTVTGRALGPTGLSTTLIVRGIVALSGARMPEEGFAAQLTQAARDLSDVFAFPNPYNAAAGHAQRVVIAGVPSGARVTVYSPTGLRVVDLEEDTGQGGVEWDLRDAGGTAVPSGIYLVRVDTDDLGSVIKKVAVIR